MIYCPKCGVSTEQVDSDGNALLSCPSCGVVWSEFLEIMANDDLWPDIVKRDKHDIICPKCGDERLTGDEAKSRTTCPSCHVRYTGSLVGKSPIEPQRIGQQQTRLPDRDGYRDNTQANSGSSALPNLPKPKEPKPPKRKLVIGEGMKQRWIFASVAVCVLGLIAYTEVKQMKLAEQQAAFQKQQLQLAEQETERQKRQEERQRQDRADVERKARLDAVFAAIDADYKGRADQAAFEHRKNQDMIRYNVDPKTGLPRDR